MGARTLDELVAYQLAVQFKQAVYDLVRFHPGAARDLRYRSQLFEAASGVSANIAEGWKRFQPREMAVFLRYGLASLEEARDRLLDGERRGHFNRQASQPALTLAGRCGAATMALLKSLKHSPYARRQK
jgi:four helix bundle protein